MAFDSTTARHAGRKSSRKGSPNRATTDLRQVVTELLEANAEGIVKDLEALEPRDRVNAWIKLLEFSLPKLTRMQADISKSIPDITIVEVVIKPEDLISDPMG